MTKAQNPGFIPGIMPGRIGFLTTRAALILVFIVHQGLLCRCQSAEHGAEDENLAASKFEPQSEQKSKGIPDKTSRVGGIADKKESMLLASGWPKLLDPRRWKTPSKFAAIPSGFIRPQPIPLLIIMPFCRNENPERHECTRPFTEYGVQIIERERERNL
jgi:hypothetical protein